MNRTLLGAYHRLPYGGRCLAAGLWGKYLGLWRYGSQTDDLVAAALERETWKPERWKAWSQEQTARLLHRAATQVPYYRELWSRRRRQGDTRNLERLDHWPLLSKEDLRNQPKAFLADDRRRPLPSHH